MSLPDPFGTAEQIDITLLRERLEELPEIDGAWPNPASLTRFNVTKMPIKMLKRFERKVKLEDLGYDSSKGPCWIWQGGLSDKGYGRFHLGMDPDTGLRITAYSHRIAFEHWVGIPKIGYIVDHECNIKTCCNPAHLWPVTNEENLRLAAERRPWRRRNQYSKE